MKRAIDTIVGVAIDLDGTLIDSVPDLAWAANAFLRTIGCEPLPQAQIVSMVGHGIDAFFREVLLASVRTMPPDDVMAGYRTRFLTLYREHIFDLGRVYPGVIAGLDRIRAGGKRLACVTNKRSDLTKPLLAASGLDGYFSAVVCADELFSRKPAPVMLESLIRSWQTERGSVLVIGDSLLDIAAARAAGCLVAVVDYGYERRETLDKAAPDWVIASFTEIDSLMLNNARNAAQARNYGSNLAC